MRILRLFKKDLAGEVTDWISDGIIGQEQGQRILARYDATLDDAKRMSIGYWALTALGVLFAGLSLILFVSYNWDDIPREARMGALFALTALVNTIGVRRFLRNDEGAGVMWLFFGSLSFGISIMLIAQIYHLGEHYPDGIFYWALGVLPMVVLTRNRIIALLVTVLTIIWMITEANEGFFPWLFPLFAALCGWLAVKGKPSALLFLILVASTVVWLEMLVSFGIGGFATFEGSQGQWAFGVGILLGLIGLGHFLMTQKKHLQDHGLALSLWLLRGLLIALIVFSFSDMWQEFQHPRTMDWILLACLPLFAGVGMLLSRTAHRFAMMELAALALVFTGAFVLGYMAQDIAAAVVINFLLLMYGIWLIRRGVIELTTHYYYSGIGLLLITATCRYFDLIGDYLGASLLFLVAAGVMFGSARFWKSYLKQSEGGSHGR